MLSCNATAFGSNANPALRLSTSATGTPRRLRLAEGEVEVYRRGPGGEAVSFGSLQATACFGEFAVISGKPGSASLRTTTGCLLGEIAPAVCSDLIRQYPSVCMPLLKKLVTLVRGFDEELVLSQPRETLIAMAYHRYVVLGSL